RSSQRIRRTGEAVRVEKNQCGKRPHRCDSREEQGNRRVPQSRAKFEMYRNSRYNSTITAVTPVVIT
ncbi:unnamed protein product, partial [Mycena citricolor]